MLPPVVSKDPLQQQGTKLVDLEHLGPRQVVEVDTDDHGTLAVGLSGDVPFAVGNVCRHQAGKLGRGVVDREGCLVCPWHRARFDVQSGQMVEGPKGRIFGFKPYSKGVEAFGHVAKLKRVSVVVRDGAIHLA